MVEVEGGRGGGGGGGVRDHPTTEPRMVGGLREPRRKNGHP